MILPLAAGPEPTSCFVPDGARARALGQKVCASFADSLAQVLGACGDVIAVDADDAKTIVAAMRRGDASPALFAAYAELVDAIHADEDARARRLVTRLLDAGRNPPPALRVATLDDALLGEGASELYVRCLNDDRATPVAIGPVDAVELARGRALVEDGLDLIARAAPELAGELDVLARQVVLVDSPRGRGRFRGASSFYLWGAVELNLPQLRDRLEMAESLVHEAAHSLLFGATLGAPLTANDPSERYPSPLRADPRPMEGLVHASFVLARMAWLQDRLLAGGLLDGDERAASAAALARDMAHYAQSRETIRRHARFTEAGAALWEGGQKWMSVRSAPV